MSDGVQLSSYGGVLSRTQAAAVEQSVKQILAQASALRAQGQHDEADATLQSVIEALMTQNAELQLRLLAERRHAAGRKSERLSPDQLALLAQVDPSTRDEDEATQEEQERKELDSEIKAAKDELRELQGKKKPKRGKGLKISDKVPKKTTRVEPDESITVCASCGNERKKIGTDLSSVLHFEPARFWFETLESDRYACGVCKDGVFNAPIPAKAFPRSVASAGVLAQVVVSKYADHCPLTRQQRIYAREGVKIPLSTLCDWVKAVAVILLPLAELLRKLVLASTTVFVDATGLPVLDRNSPGNIHRGQMWAYGDGERTVIFEFTPTGHADQPDEQAVWQVLEGREGYVQADAAAVFNGVFDGRIANAIEVGCNSHARRKFEKLKDTDARVAYPLELWAHLFRIERLASIKKLDVDERLALRQQRSRPVVERLRRWMVNTYSTEVPGTALYRATQYWLNHEEALTRFLTDGRLELTSNWVERQLRAIAQGRDNFRFAGSDAAAKRAATLYSLIRTAMLHGLDPLEYITDVLQKLGEGWPKRRLHELLPAAWLAARDD